VEPLLGLHVDAPPHDAWFVRDGLDPAGHPIEAAGIDADARLRPLDAAQRVSHANVLVTGGLLAEQRAVRERCGDGVAVASGWRAANELAPDATRHPVIPEPLAARTDQ
jgi:glycerol-3-phosphate dehydrogenase subunit B